MPEGEEKIHWCKPAIERGSPCKHSITTSKGATRGHGKRYLCPRCRQERDPKRRKDDDATGAGGSGSTLASQPHGIKVSAYMVHEDITRGLA